MAQTAISLDLTIDIVEAVVVNGIDDVFLSEDELGRLARTTISSLLATSFVVRRVVLAVLAEGLSVGLCTEGIGRLSAKPWLIIKTNPRVVPPGILGQAYDCLSTDLSALRTPVRTFYTLYTTARYALDSEDPVHVHTPSRGIRMAGHGQQATSGQCAEKARRYAALACQVARCTPVAFRPLLMERTAELMMQMNASPDTSWRPLQREASL